MEVQVDVESKRGKLRHHSGSSSMDDGSSGGHGAAVCPPGCPHEGKCVTSRWAKEPSSTSSSSSGKKSKGKLHKKSGGTKINETREDMDAQLLERRSTNSSDGSLPHFSEFSCSDLDACRPPCYESHVRHPNAGGAVSPLPENCPAAGSLPQAAVAPLTPDGAAERPLCYIAEENVSLICAADAGQSSPKERNNNLPQPSSPVRNACIQTEI
ncbi:hypothetical protein M9458_037541, partial [Cirrhinus mrigala]